MGLTHPLESFVPSNDIKALLCQSNYIKDSKMRSSWITWKALNPMMRGLTRRKPTDRGKGHAKKEAEFGAMGLQAKGSLEPSEYGRGKRGFSTTAS